MYTYEYVNSTCTHERTTMSLQLIFELGTSSRFLFKRIFHYCLFIKRAYLETPIHNLKLFQILLQMRRVFEFRNRSTVCPPRRRLF